MWFCLGALDKEIILANTASIDTVLFVSDLLLVSAIKLSPLSGLYVRLHIEVFNPSNAELNPICYLLALLAHHFLYVSRIRVKSLTLRLLMSYIYIYIYIYMERLLLMFLDHTQRRSTVGRTPLDE